MEKGMKNALLVLEALLMGLPVSHEGERGTRTFGLNEHYVLCLKGWRYTGGFDSDEREVVWLEAPSEIASLISLAEILTDDELDVLRANIGLNKRA